MKLAPEAQLYLQLRASLNLPDLRTLSPDEGRRISEETSRRWQLSDPPAVESVEQRSCVDPTGQFRYEFTVRREVRMRGCLV